MGTTAAAVGSDVHHAETATDANVSEAGPQLPSFQQGPPKDDSPSAVEDYMLCVYCSACPPPNLYPHRSAMLNLASASQKQPTEISPG